MNRVLAAILGAACCAAVAMYVLESEPDLAGFTIAIGCLALGIPLLSYASGGRRLISRFPRSLIATTRIYFALAWAGLLVYSAYWAIHSGSFGLGLSVALFGFMWVLLIFGVVVVPIWALAHFGALAYGKLRAAEKDADVSGV